MGLCHFATDLHGRPDRYRKLWDAAAAERPAALFLGGDLLPHRLAAGGDFAAGALADGFRRLRAGLGAAYPAVFLIPGNDDPAAELPAFAAGEDEGLWIQAHGRRIAWGDRLVLGYACIPPSPFLLKDWERYDVSRFVDPGCVPPEEGRRTVAREEREIRLATIAAELEELAGDADLARAICLFHCPPYGCSLDRAALDGRMIDHAPLDVHIGSIAIRRFLEARRPPLSLHGHVHEAARLTGAWQETIGATLACNGAHDGPELALVRFDPDAPAAAARVLI
ncbi:MAG: metallophosphoesterase [Candidatus Latescibacteria bacterium]|nr:metallophosphoesterase [Candidatus Latescibacterota bacterium]